MNFKHICFLSVLFLFISGCISNENKAQDNATNLDGDQQIASKNSVDYNHGEFLDNTGAQLFDSTKQKMVCCTPPPGMVSWWAGDGDANDIQGNNHGILQNGAMFAAGKVMQAYSLDGVDDYVKVLNSPTTVGAHRL